MSSAEDFLIIALAVTNLVAGFGCAVPIAKTLGRIAGPAPRFLRYYALVLGIYLLECVAFPVGMCTQVFTVGLSAVWGVVFGLWLGRRTSAGLLMRYIFQVSLYGSVPTVSFCVLLLIICVFGGRNVLSGPGGASLGIPDFLPWPFNSILGGFCSFDDRHRHYKDAIGCRRGESVHPAGTECSIRVITRRDNETSKSGA